MHKLQILTSQSGSTLQPAPGQACDQCRKRKTRCNRGHPCLHCQKTEQTCSYEQAPKARGRKPRKRVLTDDTSQQAGPPEEVASWTDTLPDLVSFTLPAVRPIDDQQLDLTQASGLDWSTPGFAQSPLLPYDPVRTSLPQESAWLAPSVAEGTPQLLGRNCFLPYVYYYFERLYAVFPVVDKAELLAILEPPELRSKPLPSSLYTFLAALSAVVIVQLNLGQDKVPSTAPGTLGLDSLPRPVSPDFLIDQCLEIRRKEGFIENADEWTILTSFFLFGYYGNFDQSRSAWYYLREAIGFAQSLGIDDPDTYLMLDLKTGQRWRALFWLLFITERAYALQRRSRAILHASISLPHVFDTPEPKLMYGFVTLARVFSTVDNDFVTAWRTQNTPLLAHAASKASTTLSKLLKEDTDMKAIEVDEMDETQRLDILVTQKWLKALAWQLQCSMDLSASSNALDSECGGQAVTRDSMCVIEASKSLLKIIHSANPPSLEVHGIGMEQKIYEVANCLCEVLETSNEPEVVLEFFSTQDFLHQFMVFLAHFRQHESPYLQPLLQRASRSLSSFVEPQRQLLQQDGRGENSAVEEIYTDQEPVSHLPGDITLGMYGLTEGN